MLHNRSMKNKIESFAFTSVYPALALLGAMWVLKSALLLVLGLRG
jgi:hypothetical protein